MFLDPVFFLNWINSIISIRSVGAPLFERFLEKKIDKQSLNSRSTSLYLFSSEAITFGNQPELAVRFPPLLEVVCGQRLPESARVPVHARALPQRRGWQEVRPLFLLAERGEEHVTVGQRGGRLAALLQPLPLLEVVDESPADDVPVVHVQVWRPRG